MAWAAAKKGMAGSYNEVSGKPAPSLTHGHVEFALLSTLATNLGKGFANLGAAANARAFFDVAGNVSSYIEE